MTVGSFLENATKKLSDAGITSARLDILVFLEDALHKNRASILAHLDSELPPSTEVDLNTKIAQRLVHTPLAYIRNQVEFYGRTFVVRPEVLVPRPETETIIDLCKSLPANETMRIADIGTGSGCIGISAALETHATQLDLYDNDLMALDVAKLNAKKFELQPRFFKEDLLSSASNRSYDVILANLPYVPDEHPINAAAKHEPKHAIFAGKDGLDLYRRLWKQMSDLRQRPLHVITESLPFQHQILAKLAASAGYELLQTKDLIQHFKRKD